MLVEHPDPRVREVLRDGLTEHGYRVLTCAGPTAPDGVSSCPVLRAERCPAVDGADAVVVARGPRHGVERALVDGIRTLGPLGPVVIESDLRVEHPLGGELGRHRLYRTVVAPLVRHLHEVLHASRHADPGT